MYNYTAAQLVPAVLADVQQDRGCSPTALVKNLQPYVGSVVTPHFAGKVKAAACELLDKKSGITYGKLRPFGKKVGELGIGAVDIVVYNGAEMRAALLKRAKAEYKEQRKHHNKKHTDAPRPPWTDDMVGRGHRNPISATGSAARTIADCRRDLFVSGGRCHLEFCSPQHATFAS